MAPHGISRFLHPHRHNDDDDDLQFAPDGRNLSDSSHPDYDPATDPELRLRVTHTAQESIHQTIQEEDRRRFRRRNPPSASHSSGAAPLSPGLKPKISLFGRNKTRRGGMPSEPGTPDAHQTPTFASPEDSRERAELERQRTHANAAAEAEESARRQDRQDGKKVKGKKGGKEDRPQADKEQDRRAVYVNLAGAATDPKGYERNKVRTSKYSLISFVPKVSSPCGFRSCSPAGSEC